MAQAASLLPASARTATVVEAGERYISEGSQAERAAIDNHVAAIERVHLVPASIEEVPVYVGDPAPWLSSIGVPGEHRTRISSPDGAIASEEIILSAQWIEVVNSTAHEIGHSLDLHGLGAELPAEDLLKDRWLSSQEEARRWREAVEASAAFALLSNSMTESRKNYFLDPRELWARGYEQWIGRRSGNENLVAKIGQRRSELPGLYWTEQEFDQVGAEIDALFATRGLAK